MTEILQILCKHQDTAATPHRKAYTNLDLPTDGTYVKEAAG